MQKNNVKDVKEKKLQLAYFISRNKGNSNKFTLDRIHRTWSMWWKDDFFKVDFSTVQKEVQKFIVDNYDDKLSPRENSDIFRKRLGKEKRNHMAILLQELESKGVKEEYYIVNRDSMRHPCKLGMYILYHIVNERKKWICEGSFETVLEYIKNEF